jgi:hypothetical protein
MEFLDGRPLTSLLGVPVPVPATPEGLPKRRWPLFAAMGGVVSVALIVLAMSVGKTPSSEARPKGEPSAIVSQAPAPPPPPAPPALEPVPDTKHVMVGADPGDAHMFLDGKDLGEQPVQVSVKAGEKLALVAKRAGYKDQSITVDDASDAKVKVKLVPAVVAAPRPKGGKPGQSGSDWKVDKNL